MEFAGEFGGESI